MNKTDKKRICIFYISSIILDLLFFLLFMKYEKETLTNGILLGLMGLISFSYVFLSLRNDNFELKSNLIFIILNFFIILFLIINFIKEKRGHYLIAMNVFGQVEFAYFALVFYKKTRMKRNDDPGK